MKTLYPTFGWKYNQLKTSAVIKKRSKHDFFISIIIAFLIIFIVSQVLAQIDNSIRSPYKSNDLSILNPFKIKQASASNEEAIRLIQSHREINIVKGQGFTFAVGLKNLTNRTWTQKGNNQVKLKIAPPFNRNTIVRHKFWRDESTPAWLKSKENKPGWIGYYRFALEAPINAGVFKEKFVLTDANDNILKGSEFEITLNVWDSTDQFPTKANHQIQQKNQPKTTTQHKLQNNKPVGLAEICLSLNPAKNKVDPLLIKQCLDIGIKVSKEGTAFIEPEPSPEPEPQPDPEPQPEPEPQEPYQPQEPQQPPVNISNGPLIRVGLYNTTELITLKINSAYQVKDQNQHILTTVPANSQSQVLFNFTTKTYTVIANQTSLSTSSYLRFEPITSNAVIEITSYEQRPAWNLSLNDNKYLGDLEIRYSNDTGNLWVINELELENYLKGLAESTNSSPMEYQKSLITAARTYAMYHYNRGTKHANEHFTVDARYDQVYKGYGAQVRLTQVTQAVEATKGNIVTYNGELAITPYFSHSDGRTRDWSEVWGGDVPWCKGVKEPAGYTKTTLFGHGVGMSAYGAILLADEHNYSYEQILKYYYTGIELKKIH